ncbi:MAG: hypothetical protein FWC41_14025 [Firmicutes bacterium]|nr:hypothetical protein [Bacillota bacterium]
MNENSFVNNIDDETLAKMIDKTLNYKKTAKNRNIKTNLLKIIPVAAAIVLFIGLINLLPFFNRIFDVGTANDGNYENSYIIITNTSESAIESSSIGKEEKSTFELEVETIKEEIIKEEIIIESTIATEAKIEITTEEIILPTITLTTESNTTLTDKNEQEDDWDDWSASYIYGLPQIVPESSWINNFDGLFESIEYIYRNIGLRNWIVGLPWYKYEIIDGYFYIIVEKMNFMTEHSILAVPAERKTGITEQNLIELRKKHEDAGIPMNAFLLGSFRHHLVSCYDVVKLDDGKWAFRAIEKVNDAGKFNLCLEQMNSAWIDYVKSMEETLGEGYFDSMN